MITYTSKPVVSGGPSTASPTASITSDSANTTLFVGDLSLFTNEIELYNHFITFGEIVEIKIMRCEETMKNLSHGFIKFVEHEPAVAAMKRMHGHILNGRPLRIKWASHKERKPAVTAADLPLARTQTPSDANYMNSSSIHVNFITDQMNSFVTEDILRDVFSRYGLVTDITLKKIEIDETKMIQKGYTFIHFPAGAMGVSSCLQCCSELKGTNVDGVKYRCDISHKLMKELSNTEDPEVMKLMERYPFLMKTLHRSNPTRRTKNRGTVLAALSQETTSYQYPFLSAYMSNLNPYATNYVQATGYTIATTTTTATTSAGSVKAGSSPGSSSHTTSTDSTEGLFNQVTFIDARDALFNHCPSLDYDHGSVYSQFGQNCWNLHTASPLRRPGYAAWASNDLVSPKLPVVPPPPPPPPSHPPLPLSQPPLVLGANQVHNVGDGRVDCDAIWKPVMVSIAEDAEEGINDQKDHPPHAATTDQATEAEDYSESLGLEIDTTAGVIHSSVPPPLHYQVASPTWFHPLNNLLLPYYSYTSFPPGFGNTGPQNGYSPKHRKKSFTSFHPLEHHRPESSPPLPKMDSTI